MFTCLYIYFNVYFKCKDKHKSIFNMTTLDFQTLEEELIAYQAMTNNEAIDFYNVDYKAEALQYILDYWSINN